MALFTSAPDATALIRLVLSELLLVLSDWFDGVPNRGCKIGCRMLIASGILPYIVRGGLGGGGGGHDENSCSRNIRAKKLAAIVRSNQRCILQLSIMWFHETVALCQRCRWRLLAFSTHVRSCCVLLFYILAFSRTLLRLSN